MKLKNAFLVLCVLGLGAVPASAAGFKSKAPNLDPNLVLAQSVGDLSGQENFVNFFACMSKCESEGGAGLASCQAKCRRDFPNPFTGGMLGGASYLSDSNAQKTPIFGVSYTKCSGSGSANGGGTF